MSNWKKRLKQAREAKGLSKTAFAKAIPVSNPTVTDWEKSVEDGGIHEITGPKLIKVCEVLGISAQWLLHGTSQGRDTSLPSRQTIDVNVEPGPDLRRERMYPVISWVQAGKWTELCENFEPAESTEWRYCHKDLGKCGYVLRVKGHSMTAPQGQPYSFPEGMLLFVNPDQEALPGKFVIVRRDATNEATFKKFVLVDGDPYLEALNPTWPNVYMKFERTDKICGVVMHAGFDMP
jgi:SOS-response transcriptional repressor LexA